MRFLLLLTVLGVVLFATRWLWRFALRPNRTDAEKMPVQSVVDKTSRWLAFAVASFITFLLLVRLILLMLGMGDDQ